MYKKKLDELEKQLSKLHPEEIKDYDDWLSAKESYALFEEDEEE